MTSPRPSGLQPVFIDTSAYFALADTTESNHRRAQAILRRLAEEPWLLFTSNFVKTETHALMLRRLGRPMALRYLHGLAAGTTSVQRVTEADEARALAIIEQYTDKNFSFTDATSFAVMDRLGITHAFHFDRNFREYSRFIDLAQQVYCRPAARAWAMLCERRVILRPQVAPATGQENEYMLNGVPRLDDAEYARLVAGQVTY